jgi:hypothetical protein
MTLHLSPNHGCSTEKIRKPEALKRMELSFWHERWERAEIGFHQQDINVHP